MADRCTAAALDGQVYVFGGSTSFGEPPLQAAYVYDPDADAWERLADMPQPRWAARAAAVNSKLYVVGGQGGATVLIYDPASDSWSEGAAIPTPREHLAAAVYDGRIYAIGGRTSGGNVSSAEVYDPGADAWSETAPMPTARSGLAAAVAGDRIVVAGGENPSAWRN